MRYTGYILLGLGLLGVIIDNIILASIGTIIGSILMQGALIIKYRNNIKCN